MPVESLTDPLFEDALDLLDTGFEREGMLTLVGECEVEYDGRASSYLGMGERLVILKSDGTLLVHRDEQRTPVNWQPPGCTHDARVENDHFVVQSTRTSPHEEVTISFEALAQVSLLELDNTPDLALSGSEEDLRQRILADPDVLEEGFQAMMTERAEKLLATEELEFVSLAPNDASSHPTRLTEFENSYFHAENRDQYTGTYCTPCWQSTYMRSGTLLTAESLRTSSAKSSDCSF
jgi:RecB family endonuclease NucS